MPFIVKLVKTTEKMTIMFKASLIINYKKYRKMIHLLKASLIIIKKNVSQTSMPFIVLFLHNLLKITDCV